MTFILRHQFLRGSSRASVDRCSICEAERRTVHSRSGSERQYRSKDGDWARVPPGCRLAEQGHLFDDYPLEFLDEEAGLSLDPRPTPEGRDDSGGNPHKRTPRRESLPRNAPKTPRFLPPPRRDLLADPYATLGLRKRPSYTDPSEGSLPDHEEVLARGYSVLLSFDDEYPYEFGVLGSDVEIPIDVYWKDHTSELTALGKASETMARVAAMMKACKKQGGARAMLKNRETGDLWQFSLIRGKFTCTLQP